MTNARHNRPVNHPLVKAGLQRIKRSRKKQYEIAAESGVDRATIYNWEHGRTTPTLVAFEAVLNALGYELQIVQRGHTVRPPE